MGHGELLLRPEYAQWAGAIAANRASAEDWRFSLAGVDAPHLRAMARQEVLSRASHFSERLGVPVREPGDAMGVIVATGHQPELYHPGIWVKDFLLQRIADETDGTPVDVVVDSDGFETVALTAPCLVPEVRRCSQTLAVGTAGGWFAEASVPRDADIDAFVGAGAGMLATLPAPAVSRHFASFAESLRSAAADASSLAELVTFARRRYEASAGTDYLELPVTSLVSSRAFAVFVAGIARDARRFATVYNASLEEFRTVTGTRSKAQPFPDLEITESTVELPLWGLSRGGRTTVRVDFSGDYPLLTADGEALCVLGADEAESIDRVAGCGCSLAPKALALTLFVRMFCCDLFIHGVGGGRYDQVTDAVIRGYFGVEPPTFVIASLTMYLPLGAHVVTDEELSAAKDRLNRLAHNADALLDEVDFEDDTERHRAFALAEEKAALKAAISTPDADRKSLGLRIRQVNVELSELLAPLKETFAAEVASLESQRATSEVLTDRGYPFCLWAPEEVADKVR